MCVATHLVTQSLRLDDPLAVISVHGVGGLWGLLAVGVFAHGRVGAGWNGVGIKEYLGVASQGVTGLLPAGGLAADPGQMQAQLIGALAISGWVLVSTWLLFKLTWRPRLCPGGGGIRRFGSGTGGGMSEPAAPRPQLVRLDFRLGSSLSWVGSALAVVAGALASHRLGLDAASLLTLILALLLADPLLGGLWNVLVSADWAAPWRESPSPGDAAAAAPRGGGGSPAHRVSEWLARLLGHGLEQSPRGILVPLSEAGFYLVSASALAAVLGAPVILVVVAAFSLAVIRVLLGGGGQRHRWLETAYAFAVPWLVGYGAFGALPVDAQPASLVALALGVAMTLAYHGTGCLPRAVPFPARSWRWTWARSSPCWCWWLPCVPGRPGWRGCCWWPRRSGSRLWREERRGLRQETQGFLALAVLACFL